MQRTPPPAITRHLYRLRIRTVFLVCNVTILAILIFYPLKLFAFGMQEQVAAQLALIQTPPTPFPLRFLPEPLPSLHCTPAQQATLIFLLAEFFLVVEVDQRKQAQCKHTHTQMRKLTHT